jgi:hypothetical protein
LFICCECIRSDSRRVKNNPEQRRTVEVLRKRVFTDDDIALNSVIEKLGKWSMKDVTDVDGDTNPKENFEWKRESIPYLLRIGSLESGEMW